MFGSNLKALLEDTARVNHLVQQNKPAQNPSTPRSFSRGRGNQSAQRGFQHGRFPKQQGRGLGRGWQLNTNTQNQQNLSKSGQNQAKQTTKR